MTWNYIQHTGRLNIYGSDAVRDIQTVKKLMREGKIPVELNTIFYQKSHQSTVGIMFRGRYLDNLLKVDETAPSGKPSFRSILKQINETNTRQTAYSGVLIFATNTKRFLLLMPNHRKVWGLLGDNLQESETPPETVVRVAKDDCNFEVTANCLITLKPVDLEGTTYYNYLILSNHEFKPALSNQFLASTWRSYEAMDELPLHPSVELLFDHDPKLFKLITPIEVDFEKLIAEILHSSD